VVTTPRVVQVITYRNAVSWGEAPLPVTTCHLKPDGAQDLVRIVERSGGSTTETRIQVARGTYAQWLDRLTAMNAQRAEPGPTAPVSDASRQDLWFPDNGRKVHLHWMGQPPLDCGVITSFTLWLAQLEPENRSGG
jgi:hypothetical protein